MFLFQNRVGKKHPGSGLESPKKRFWGAPYHGLSVGGVVTLPNAAFHFTALGGANVLAWAAQSAIPVQNVNATLPSLVRDAEELAIDTAEGFQWKDYGLLCGTFKTLYGGTPTPISGPPALPAFQHQIGHAGWLYSAPDGTMWRLWLHEFERAIAGTNGLFTAPTWTSASAEACTVKAQRFGIVRSQVEGEAPDATIYSFSKTLNTSPGFTGSVVARVAVGTMSLGGDKAAFYLIHPNALAPSDPGPSFPPYWGGWPAFGLHRDVQAWIATCTGTPGVDFDITITPYDHGTDAFSQTAVSFDKFVHVWVTPGGVVEEFRTEKVPLINSCIVTGHEAACADLNPGPPCDAFCVGGWREDSRRWFAERDHESELNLVTPSGTFGHTERSHTFHDNFVDSCIVKNFPTVPLVCDGISCWTGTTLDVNNVFTFEGFTYSSSTVSCGYFGGTGSCLTFIFMSQAAADAFCAADADPTPSVFPFGAQQNGPDCIWVRTLDPAHRGLPSQGLPENWDWTAITPIGTFTFDPSPLGPSVLGSFPPKVFFDGGDAATLLSANFASSLTAVRIYV